MAYTEHLGGNRYKLIARDPNHIKRKRVTKNIEVPADIMKSTKKTQQWITLELAKYAEEVENGKLVRTDKLSFRDFVPQWKKGYADQFMSPNTRRNNMTYIETYLMPEFGDTRIDKIQPLHLVTFFAELTKKDGTPMATNTKLNIFKVTKSIFDAAHEWKVIPDNPITGVKRPTQSKAEKKKLRGQKHSYTWDEVLSILRAMHQLPDGWRLYFTGAILGGFRRGELLAVEWTDLDFENNAIFIEKQITFDEEGNKTEAEVKTEESEGWVPMPRWYMDELKKFHTPWKKQRLMCKQWEGGKKNYIWHGGKGVMYYPSTATLTWSRFLKKHKLPHVKLHGLRHTAGMLLRENGTDIKTIQERLRHTKINTTADIYTHQSTTVSRAAADQLEALNPAIAPRVAPYA